MKELFELAYNILQLKPQPPKPTFPPDLMKLLNKFELKFPKGKSPSLEDLIEKYILNTNDRYELIIQLQQQNQIVNASERNQQFASIVILQSFLALLYSDIDSIPVHSIQVFVQSLTYAIQINNAISSFACEEFQMYCRKVLKAKKFYSLLSSVDSILNILPNTKPLSIFLVKSLTRISLDAVIDSKVSIKFHIFSFMKLYPLMEKSDEVNAHIQSLTSQIILKLDGRVLYYYYLLIILCYQFNEDNQIALEHLDQYIKSHLLGCELEFPPATEKHFKYIENRSISDLPPIESAFRSQEGCLSDLFFALLNIHDPIIDNALPHFLKLTMDAGKYNIILNLILLHAGTNDFKYQIKNPVQTFFNPKIFNPCYSLYDTEVSYMISIRKYSIDCFYHFLKQDFSYINIYFEFLSSAASYPWLFAEILTFSKEIFQLINTDVHASILMECICQFMLTKAGNYEDNFFPVLFSTIKSFLTNPKIYEQIMINPLLIDLLFKNTIDCQTCSDIIYILFENFLETPIDSIFINIMIENFKSDIKFASKIMKIFEKFSNNSKMASFIHLKLFKDVMIQTGKYNDPELTQMLIEFISSLQRKLDFSKLPFSSMIEEITLNDGMYESLLRMISNSSKFIGIRGEVSIDIIRKIFSTEYFVDFMQRVKELVCNSIVECYYCNKFGFSLFLIESVQKRDKIEDVDLILEVFKEINKWNSSRPILFSYLGLLSNETNKRSRYAEKLLEALSETIKSSQDQVLYAFLFTPGAGSLIIPHQINYSTFVINIYMILCNLTEPQRLITIKSEGETVTFSISPTSLSIIKNFTVIASKNIPFNQNEWTNFTFQISSNDLILYINNNTSVQIKSQVPIIKSTVDSMEIFCDELTGEAAHVSIFSGSLDDRMLNVIHSDTTEYTTVIHEPSLLMLYSAHYVEGNQVSNALQNTFESATTTCINLSFISSFRRIFETSKGTHFLTSLFSQIDFYTYQGTRNNIFLMQLLQSFTDIIQGAPQIQDLMEQVNTFAVIAYFLSQPTITEYLNSELWQHIYILEQHIKNPVLLEQFQTNVLLNLEIWRRSTKKECGSFMLCCHRVCQSNEQTFFSLFNINSLCDLFLYIVYENEFTETNISILKNLFKKAVKIRFGQKETVTMLKMVSYFNGNFQKVSVLVKFLKSMAKVRPDMWSFIVTKVFELVDLVQVRILIIKSIPTYLITTAFSLMMSKFDKFSDSKKEEYFNEFNNAIEPNKWNTNLFVFMLCFAFRNKMWNSVAIQTCLLCFESLKFIEKFKNLGISGIGIVTAYFMFCNDKNSVKIFGRFLAKSITITKDVFAISSVIESLTNMNFDKFVSDLLTAVIETAFSKEEKSVEEKLEYFHFIVEKIFFRHNHSTINKKPLRNFETVDIKSFILLLTTVRDRVSFNYGYSISEEGFWLDEDLSVELLHQAWLSFNTNCLNMIDYMCLMSFVMKRNINKSKKFLFDENYHIVRESEFAAPLILSVCANAKEFEVEEKVDENLMQKSVEVLEKFYQYLIQNFDTRKIYFEQVVEFPDFPFDPANSIAEIQSLERAKEKELAANLRRSWHRLWQTVSHDRSPFISSSSFIMMPHFKIGNHFDKHFMPSVLVVNNHFTNHLDAKNKATVLTQELNENKPPSHFFFDKDTNESKSSSIELVDVLWRSPCERIKITKNFSGDFYVIQSGLVFKSQTKSILIPREQVKYLFWVWVNQRPNAIQIYTNSYSCYLFRFPKVENHKFVTNLIQIGFPNAEFIQENPPNIEIERLGLTHKWMRRQLSNFDYLIWLNILSGRSFLDSRVYPIFPTIALNNSTQEMEDKDEDYRDLTKNIMFINPSSSQRMKERISIFQHNGETLFCHPSYLSNAYTVNHYLIRMEPFTTLHIMMQDGHFDVGPRLFISLHDNINRMMSKMPSFREFTPEFYQNESFLLNSNDLPLGKYNETDDIGDVVIPAWSSSPADFIYKHRNLLESERVSQVIHGWIDLIWGFKQKGQSAADAMNTFDPQIYPDIWQKTPENNEEEQMLAEAVTAKLNTIGQIPQQLFTSPHPKRNPIVTEQFNGNAVALHNIPDDVACVICSGSVFEKMKIYAALRNGRVFCLRLAATNFEVQLMKHAKIPADPKKIAHFKSESNDDFIFAFAQDHSAKVTILNVIKRSIIRSKTSPHLSEINCISVARNMILSGGEDALATLWLYDGKDSIEQLNFIMAHRSEITCCCLSEVFGIAITCSPDNTMIITSLPELTFIRAVDLRMPPGSIPSSVVMTSHVGYIVVFFGNQAETFTANGMFCNTNQFESNIVSACIAESKYLVEYVVALLANNSILLLEPYSLKIVRVVWRGGAKVKEVGYHKDSNNFILITENANVILVPAFFQQ